MNAGYHLCICKFNYISTDGFWCFRMCGWCADNVIERHYCCGYVKNPPKHAKHNLNDKCVYFWLARRFLSGTFCASRRIATDIPTQIMKDISVGYAYSCLACLFMSQISVIGSVLSILAIAVDRFIAVVYPLRHPSIVVKNKVKIYIACSWTVILMICSYTFWSPLAPNYYLTQCQALSWVDGRYFLCIFLSTTLSSILVTTVLYIYILCVSL